MAHPDGEDATPTAGPAPTRMSKPGTSEFAHAALRKSEARESHLLEVAIDALEDRAKSAEDSLAAERRERRLERVAWGAVLGFLVLLILGMGAIIYGRTLEGDAKGNVKIGGTTEQPAVP